MDALPYRRVIYRSLARGGAGLADLSDILIQSRLNNGIDGLSGLLWTDGSRYVQLLEGPPDSVVTTLERILRDPRHGDVELVSDDMRTERAFGEWTMANLPGDRTQNADERLDAMLARAPDDVRDVFVALT